VDALSAQIRERVSILKSAARSLAAGCLTDPEQEEAGAAHTSWPAVLGTFNLSHGTDLARQLEVFYSAEGTPDPIFAAQAASLASELHTIVETRVKPPPIRTN